jgi:hypothetical protein
MLETEQLWGFSPIKTLNYYLAESAEELDKMKGFDYDGTIDELNPSGMTVDSTTIFCQGLGEKYFHEVLHIYFDQNNYRTSPISHGMIYFLAGSLGHDFNWFIHRMNEYVVKYPETDFTDYLKLETKDKFLHIDHTVNGLLCKIVFEKEGIAGLKRLLTYKNMDEIFEKEFHVKKEEGNNFLRSNFKKFDVVK